MKNNNLEKEIKICPSCLAHNETNIDFCKRCGRPLGDFVNYGPIKRIYSIGWMYRKSISNPSSPIVFYGIWFLFGIPLFLVVLLFFSIKWFWCSYYRNSVYIS